MDDNIILLQYGDSIIYYHKNVILSYWKICILRIAQIIVYHVVIIATTK